MTAPTFVLVHGAWHDSSCWRSLTNILESRGCTVEAPDLPGHGGNTLPLEKVTLKKYVQAIQQVLERQDHRVVLVAHSMAGLPATEAACKLPDRISRLVYLCAYLPLPGDSLFGLIAQLRGAAPPTRIESAMSLSDDKRRCMVQPDQVADLFYTDLAETRATDLAAAFGTQASLPLSARVDFSQDVFASLQTAYICCSHDQVIPPLHQRRMVARQPCKTLLQADLDHSPFHSDPDTLARLLLSLA